MTERATSTIVPLPIPSGTARRGARPGGGSGRAIPDTLNARAHARRSRGWEERFLARLRELPNASAACAAAGIGRTWAYHRRDEDPAFRERWDEAIEESIDHLEKVAWERAMGGMSDRLIEMLLRAHRPEKYREVQRREISGPAGGAVPVTPMHVLRSDEERRIVGEVVRAEIARRKAEGDPG